MENTHLRHMRLEPIHIASVIKCLLWHRRPSCSQWRSATRQREQLVSNTKSWLIASHINWHLNIVGAPGKEEAGHQKLEDMIRELSGSLVGVKHEQEYMHIRDRIHRQINDNTNSKVVWWSIFEAAILVFMTVGQIYYLKRFFEVKRVVWASLYYSSADRSASAGIYCKIFKFWEKKERKSNLKLQQSCLLINFWF